MNPSNSLESYVNLYNGFYQDCLATTYFLDAAGGNSDAFCISQSSLKTFKKLSDDLAKRGPHCKLSSYVVVMMREANLEDLPQSIGDAFQKKSVKEVIKTINRFAVPLAGCLVGGTVAASGGGLVGFLAGGKEGATLGAALSFPIGCAEGASIATEVYVLYKGFNQLKHVSDLYKKIVNKSTKIYEALISHHKMCDALAIKQNVKNTLPFNTDSSTSRLQTPILWEKVKSNQVRIYSSLKTESITSPYQPIHSLSPPPVQQDMIQTAEIQPMPSIRKREPSFEISFVAPSLTLLAINFISDPKGFVRGIARLPETVVNELGSLFGIKKKWKKQEDNTVCPSESQLEIVGEKIINLIRTCYTLAQKQWIIHPDMTLELYTNTLFNDWKVAVLEKKRQIFFPDFVSHIQKELEIGHFLIVHEMSPSTHLKTQSPPKQVISSFIDLEVTSIALASSAMLLGEKTKKENATSEKLNEKYAGLDQKTNQLSGAVDALAANPDKLAALRERVRRRVPK